jgi:hypothetical protein
MMNLDTIKNISPAWWGVVAGAVAAGATLFADHRLVGGLGAGAVALYFAAKKSAPCCAACAEAATPTAPSSTDSKLASAAIGSLDAVAQPAPAPTAATATLETASRPVTTDTGATAARAVTVTGGLDEPATSYFSAPTYLAPGALLKVA